MTQEQILTLLASTNPNNEIDRLQKREEELDKLKIELRKKELKENGYKRTE